MGTICTPNAIGFAYLSYRRLQEPVIRVRSGQRSGWERIRDRNEGRNREPLMDTHEASDDVKVRPSVKDHYQANLQLGVPTESTRGRIRDPTTVLHVELPNTPRSPR